MSTTKKTKTEHSGAKNGGGYWGTREEAKSTSKKLRRQQTNKEIESQTQEE